MESGPYDVIKELTLGTKVRIEVFLKSVSSVLPENFKNLKWDSEKINFEKYTTEEL